MNGWRQFLLRSTNLRQWLARNLSLPALRDRLFGYDLFISYDFAEAARFAEALKTSAEQASPPIRCFLDQHNFSIGDELSAAARRRVRMSKYMTVIVTPGVGAEDSWVPKELRIFTRGGTRKLGRIAPLNVEDSIERLPRQAEIFEYLPYADGPEEGRSVLFHRITADEFESGPSPATLERLQSFIGARRVDSTRLRFFQGATAVLLVLSLVAIGLAVIANRQRNEARRARDQAIDALRTQSRLLLDVASEAKERGDEIGAYLLALEGLPDAGDANPVRRQWPHVADLEAYLHDNLREVGEERLVSAWPSSGPFALDREFSRLLIGGELRDAADGSLIKHFKEMTAEVPTIFFASQGQWVVWLEEGQARVLDTEDGKEIDSPLAEGGEISSLAFNRSTNFAVTLHFDGSGRPCPVRRQRRDDLGLRVVEDLSDGERARASSAARALPRRRRE